MRTTIDLPDPIFRLVKARAALEGRTLKQLLAEYVEQGLARQAPLPCRSRRRGDPPVFERAAGSGVPTPALTNAEIAAILDEEDADRIARLTGR